MRIVTVVKFKEIESETKRQGKKKVKMAENYDKLVREKVEYILESTKEKYYTYKSMMLWVAEETKSVLTQCDESKLEFTFQYVGV